MLVYQRVLSNPFILRDIFDETSSPCPLQPTADGATAQKSFTTVCRSSWKPSFKIPWSYWNGHWVADFLMSGLFSIWNFILVTTCNHYFFEHRMIFSYVFSISKCSSAGFENIFLKSHQHQGGVEKPHTSTESTVHGWSGYVGLHHFHGPKMSFLDMWNVKYSQSLV